MKKGGMSVMEGGKMTMTVDVLVTTVTVSFPVTAAVIFVTRTMFDETTWDGEGSIR
jgi:hypothetical protein